MLDKQQEELVKAQFGEVRKTKWFEWLTETVAANRDAALNKMENAAELNDLQRHQSESKAWRQVMDLLTKFSPSE